MLLVENISQELESPSPYQTLILLDKTELTTTLVQKINDTLLGQFYHINGSKYVESWEIISDRFRLALVKFNKSFPISNEISPYSVNLFYYYQNDVIPLYNLSRITINDCFPASVKFMTNHSIAVLRNKENIS